MVKRQNQTSIYGYQFPIFNNINFVHCRPELAVVRLWRISGSL